MRAELINIGLSSDQLMIKQVDQESLNSPFHFHNSCEMVLVHESSGKRIVGDHVDSFTDGDLVIMGPNLPHIWQNDTHGRNFRNHRVKALVIYFSPAFLLDMGRSVKEEASTAEFLENISRGLIFNQQVHELAISKLQQLEQSSGLKRISIFLEVMDLLVKTHSFQHLASEKYRHSYNSKDTRRFNDVYQFLIHNFHREISLEEVAEIGKMSTNAFCRYFKTKTQKSFTTFLNELRVGHACKLLKKTNHSIAEISFESGFNNLVNFNKTFKKITHRTPREFRLV